MDGTKSPPPPRQNRRLLCGIQTKWCGLFFILGFSQLCVHKPSPRFGYRKPKQKAFIKAFSCFVAGSQQGRIAVGEVRLRAPRGGQYASFPAAGTHNIFRRTVPAGPGPCPQCPHGCPHRLCAFPSSGGRKAPWHLATNASCCLSCQPSVLPPELRSLDEDASLCSAYPLDGWCYGHAWELFGSPRGVCLSLDKPPCGRSTRPSPRSSSDNEWVRCFHPGAVLRGGLPCHTSQRVALWLWSSTLCCVNP